MNTSSDTTGPSRQDVDRRWSALAEGHLSREDAHAWAAQWVESRDSDVADPMVRNGLQHLHGYDLMAESDRPSVVMHGQGDSYVHTPGDIEDQLTTWRANCILYDADPAGYSRTVRARAVENMRRVEEGGQNSGPG